MTFVTVFLETERLVLRRFTADDADDLFALHDDPDVMHFLNGGRPASRERIRTVVMPKILSYYERYDGLGLWAAVEKPSGTFIGWFELTPAGDGVATHAELGYRLHRSAWGRGLATEGSRALVHTAFTKLGVERVVADTMAVNSRSRSVMEKCGLRLVRRFHTPWDGPYPVEGHDQGEVEYALDRDEWLAGPQASGVTA